MRIRIAHVTSRESPLSSIFLYCFAIAIGGVPMLGMIGVAIRVTRVLGNIKECARIARKRYVRHRHSCIMEIGPREVVHVFGPEFVTPPRSIPRTGAWHVTGVTVGIGCLSRWPAEVVFTNRELLAAVDGGQVTDGLVVVSNRALAMERHLRQVQGNAIATRVVHAFKSEDHRRIGIVLAGSTNRDRATIP